ncbi:MAG: Uncharacterised protein [Cellulomonadaceae bacterium TMED98]|nr:MAG: Uncharacterised protein [Cellulomonadaceae bacterium TMED98]
MPIGASTASPTRLALSHHAITIERVTATRRLRIELPSASTTLRFKMSRAPLPAKLLMLSTSPGPAVTAREKTPARSQLMIAKTVRPRDIPSTLPCGRGGLSPKRTVGRAPSLDDTRKNDTVRRVWSPASTPAVVRSRT